MRDVVQNLLEKVINQGAGNKSQGSPAEAQGEQAKANVSPSPVRVDHSGNFSTDCAP